MSNRGSEQKGKERPEGALVPETTGKGKGEMEQGHRSENATGLIHSSVYSFKTVDSRCSAYGRICVKNCFT